MRLQSLARQSAVAVTLVVLAASAAGCGGEAPKAAPTFRNSFLAFGYPAAWKPGVFKITGELPFAPMLYLSSQSLPQPCHTKQLATVCGWPVDRLEPRGGLVVWEKRGEPGWAPRHTPCT